MATLGTLLCFDPSVATPRAVRTVAASRGFGIGQYNFSGCINDRHATMVLKCEYRANSIDANMEMDYGTWLNCVGVYSPTILV